MCVDFDNIVRRFFSNLLTILLGGRGYFCMMLMLFMTSKFVMKVSISLRSETYYTKADESKGQKKSPSLIS